MAKNALRKTSKMHFENYEDAFQVGTNEHIEYGPLKEESNQMLKRKAYMNYQLTKENVLSRTTITLRQSL